MGKKGVICKGRRRRPPDTHVESFRWWAFHCEKQYFCIKKLGVA